jgi:hypothetical protein
VTGAPKDHADLRGRCVLLVHGRAEERDGPDVDALAVRLRGAGARVRLLGCTNIVADLVGRRVPVRPHLVVALLPGRGPAVAGVRVAERFGVPLLALVHGDGAASWGEPGTLRRAVRVLLTAEDLRGRVLAAGVRADRIERWHPQPPGALAGFERSVVRALHDTPRTPPAGLRFELPGRAARAGAGAAR